MEILIIYKNENLQLCDRTKVVVTPLGPPVKKEKKQMVDWDSFSVPSERCKDVEAYMRERHSDERNVCVSVKFL